MLTLEPAPKAFSQDQLVHEPADAACPSGQLARRTNPLLKLVGMDPFHLPLAASHGRLARKGASPHLPLLARQWGFLADPNANLGRVLGDCQQACPILARKGWAASPGLRALVSTAFPGLIVYLYPGSNAKCLHL